MKVRVRDAPGAPVLASPFGAPPRPLPYTVDGAVIEVVVPFDDGPAALVVFAPGTSERPAAELSPDYTETLEGDWEGELVPTLDNTWGDFAWPPAPGPRDRPRAAGPGGSSSKSHRGKAVTYRFHDVFSSEVPQVVTPEATYVVERWALEHRVEGEDGWRPAHATF